MAEGDSGGALWLKGETLTVVNNVVFRNGLLGTSNLGGFDLSPTSLTFYHNTVAENWAATGKAAGVICSGGENLVNSILWGNVGAGQHLGCTFTNSDIAGGGPGTGNINIEPDFTAEFSLNPGSPCIDKGAPTTGITVIDILGESRSQGAAPDMGAYEVE